MGSVEINPSAPPKEPELHLLVAQEMFEEPLWKSLFSQLDEFFFPKKLPPLKLESKPEPVKDIWGFYNYKKDGVLGSTGVHILIAAIIVGGTLWAHRVVTAAPAPKATVMLVDPDVPALKPGSNTRFTAGRKAAWMRRKKWCSMSMSWQRGKLSWLWALSR